MAKPVNQILLPNGESRTLPKAENQMTKEDWDQFFSETDSYLSQPKTNTILLPNGANKVLPKPENQMSPDDWKLFFNETDQYLANNPTITPPIKPDPNVVQRQNAGTMMSIMAGDTDPNQLRVERPSDRIAYQGARRQASQQQDLENRITSAQQQLPAINEKINSFRDQNGSINQRAMLDAVNSELSNGGDADWFFKWYPANVSLNKMISDVALDEFQKNAIMGIRGTRANSPQNRYASIINRDAQLRDAGNPGAIQDIFSKTPSVLPPKESEVEDIPEVIRSPLADISGAFSGDRSMFDVPITTAFAMAADDPGKIDILDKKLGPFSQFFEYNLDPRGAVQVYAKKGLQQAVADYEKSNPPTDFYQSVDLNSLKQIQDGSHFYINRPGASRQDFAEFVGSLPTQVATAIPAAKLIKGGGMLFSALRGGLSGSSGSVLQDVIAQGMGSNEDVSLTRAILGGIGGSAGDVIGSAPLRRVTRSLNNKNPERVLEKLFDKNGDITPYLQGKLTSLEQGLSKDEIANLGPEYVAKLRQNLLDSSGDIKQAVNLTDSQMTDVPLTIGQMTRNPLYSARERQAANGMFGDKYADLMNENLQKQQQAFRSAGENQLAKYNTSLEEQPADILAGVRDQLASQESSMMGQKNKLYLDVKDNMKSDNPLTFRGNVLYEMRKGIGDYLRDEGDVIRDIAPRSFDALDKVDDIIRDLAEHPTSGISKKMIREKAPELNDKEVEEIYKDAIAMTKGQARFTLGDRRLRSLTPEEQDMLVREELMERIGGNIVSPDDVKGVLAALSHSELKRIADKINIPLGVGGTVPNRPIKRYAEKTDMFNDLVKQMQNFSGHIQEVSYADLSKIGNNIRNLRFSNPTPADLTHLGRIQKIYDDVVENKVADNIVSGDPLVIEKHRAARQAAKEHAHIFGRDSFLNKLLQHTSKIINPKDPETKIIYELDAEKAAKTILNLEGTGLRSQASDYVSKLVDLGNLRPKFKPQLDLVKGALINNMWRQSINKSMKEAGEIPFINGASLSNNIWKTLRENKTTFNKLFNREEMGELHKLARIASAIGVPVRGTANPSGSGHLFEQLIKRLPVIGRLTALVTQALPNFLGGISKKSLSFADKPLIKGVRVARPEAIDPLFGAAVSDMGSKKATERDIRKHRRVNNPTGISDEFLEELQRMGQ